MRRALIVLSACLLSTAVLAQRAAPEAVFKLQTYRKTVAMRASVHGAPRACSRSIPQAASPCCHPHLPRPSAASPGAS